MGSLVVLALISAAVAQDRCVEEAGRKVCLEGPSAPDLPLVIYLHGYGGEGADDALGLHGLAEHERFLYVAPDALKNQDGYREWRHDDGRFLLELIPRLVAAGHADPSRVYLAGFSAGGFAALELACARPAGFAAVVSVSGSRLEPAEKCAPGAVSTLQVHGEDDTIVSPAGGVGRRTGRRYLSAMAVATQAAEAAGCKSPLAPAQWMAAMRVERASDCRGGAKVELWMVPGMGHRSTVEPKMIWEFLQARRDVTGQHSTR
jgi:polyhydroxybutyrate depolymerase